MFNISFQNIYVLENNQLWKNIKEEGKEMPGGGKLGNSVSCPTFFFRGKRRGKEREQYWLMSSVREDSREIGHIKDDKTPRL